MQLWTLLDWSVAQEEAQVRLGLPTVLLGHSPSPSPGILWEEGNGETEVGSVPCSAPTPAARREEGQCSGAHRGAEGERLGASLRGPIGAAVAPGPETPA